MEVVEWLIAAGFLVLALAALRLRLRWRTASATWLLLTFGTLGGAVVTSRLLPEGATGTAAAVARTAVEVAVVAFPYLLARFAATFGRVSRATHVTGAVLAAAAVVGLFTVDLTGTDGPAQGAARAYLLYVLAYWTLLSGWVAVRLWRAGRGRPGVARRRMRLLAAASIALNAALVIVIAGATTGVSGDRGLTIVIDLVSIASVALFYLAFAPPGIVRREWRRPEEDRLRDAEAALMRATTREETGAVLARSVAALLGGAAALLDTDGRPVAGWGLAPGEMERTAALVRRSADVDEGAPTHRDRTILLRLHSGWLVARGDEFTPLFEAEELSLLGRLGVFADLALQRADLLQGERAARAEVQRGAAELEALLYGISHDLRNPLVSIRGYVDLLQAEHAEALDDAGRRYLQRLDANTQYMDALISDLLELSRIGRTEEGAQAVDLRALVRDIAVEAAVTHPKATVDVGPLPVVRMSPVRARQLFTNLVTNALRHAGRADVRVCVTTDGEADGEGVTVSVADDGQGIPEPYRRKVFGIFERLGGGGVSESGTGVGLAMCQRIVEQVGGRIWIADTPTGTDVRVRFAGQVLVTPPREGTG